MICIRLEVKHDLIIIDILVILLLGIIYFFPENSIRIILGLLFALFFPGYVLIAALFPERENLDGVERLALSFGLSIAVLPLMGLVLNFTPWGIRLFPVLVSLMVFIFLLSLVAFFRRRSIPLEERFLVSFELESPIGKGDSKLDRILSFFLLLSILIAFFAIIYVIVTPRKGERFTEFYVLGPNGRAEGYPSNMTFGERSSLIIGVINHEYEVTRYDLRVTFEDGSIYEKGFNLNHNGAREINYVFEPKLRGKDMRLEFFLFKNKDFSKPYRELHLWLSVE